MTIFNKKYMIEEIFFIFIYYIFVPSIEHTLRVCFLLSTFISCFYQAIFFCFTFSFLFNFSFLIKLTGLLIFIYFPSLLSLLFYLYINLKRDRLRVSVSPNNNHKLEFNSLISMKNVKNILLLIHFFIIN